MGVRYWLWICLLGSWAWAQPGDCLKDVLSRMPAASPSSYGALVQEALACSEGDQEAIFSTYLDLGIAFFRMGEGAMARSCLDSLLAQAPEGHPARGAAARVKALTYERTGDFLAAEAPYLEAVAEFSRQEGAASPLAACSKSLGNLYTRFGDYEQAVYYLNQSVQQYRLAAARPARIAQAWVDLGEAYAWQDSLEAALACYDSALALPGITGLERGLASLASGRVNGLLGRKQRAQAQMKTALDELEKTGPTAYVAECWQGLGELAILENAFSRAETYLQKALEVNKRTYNSPFRRERAKIYLALGQLHLKQTHWQESLKYFQQALACVLPDDTDTTQLSQIPDPGSYYKENVILEGLEGKMEAWRMGYEATGETDFLDRILETYEALIRIEDLLRFSYDYASSKLMLASSSHKRAEQGIEAAFQLFEARGKADYFEKILLFAERSKAGVLLEELRHLQGVESLLPEKDRKRLDQETWLQSGLQQELNQAGSAQEKDSLRLRIEAQHQKVNHLIDSLEEAFPDYYRFKYALRTPKPEDILNSLGKDRGLLEYFWGENGLYAICLRREGLNVLKLEMPASEAADSLLRGISGRWLDPDSLRQPAGWYDDLLLRQTWYWSQRIWDPVANYLPEAVVIVPDGPLGYIPFDLLFSKPATSGQAYRSWPFLLYERRFSYAYSFSWLQQLGLEKQAKGSEWLGVAPLSWEDPRLAPLPWGAEEGALAGLKKEGNMLLGEQAGKKAFLSRLRSASSPFQVLHLSTHARAFPRNPGLSWIAFSDKGEENQADHFLYLPEIYQLHIPAEMVVLSACETATGQMLEGEGIMSLARGFAFSGCQSVVSTLWPLRDRPASWIMENFYSQLGKGMTKDQALRQSRLAYLKSEAFSEKEGHPYYWAAWRVAGDIRPLDTALRSKWFLAIGIIFLLAAAAWWISKMRGISLFGERKS